MNELNKEDWLRIMFILGMILLILATPIKFVSEYVSNVSWLIGIILFSGSAWISSREEI